MKWYHFSQHCDFYEPLEPLPSNEAYVVVSDAASRRFETSKSQFVPHFKLTDPSEEAGVMELTVQPHLSADFKTKAKIAIDAEQKYQTMLGFGGAFTDAAGINIANLPAKLQETLLRLATK